MCYAINKGSRPLVASLSPFSKYENSGTGASCQNKSHKQGIGWFRPYSNPLFFLTSFFRAIVRVWCFLYLCPAFCGSQAVLVEAFSCNGSNGCTQYRHVYLIPMYSPFFNEMLMLKS